MTRRALLPFVFGTAIVLLAATIVGLNEAATASSMADAAITYEEIEPGLADGGPLATGINAVLVFAIRDVGGAVATAAYPHSSWLLSGIGLLVIRAGLIGAIAGILVFHTLFAVRSFREALAS